MIKNENELEGLKFISPKTGCEYELLELINFGGKVTSDMIAIVDMHLKDDNLTPEIVGYFFGATEYRNIHDPAILDEIDEMCQEKVSEYEEKRL